MKNDTDIFHPRQVEFTGNSDFVVLVRRSGGDILPKAILLFELKKPKSLKEKFKKCQVCCLVGSAIYRFHLPLTLL